MAFIPYTLKQANTFTRSHSNESITLQPGEVVQRETTESDTHTFHTFRITRNGYLWFCIHNVSKQSTSPVTVRCRRCKLFYNNLSICTQCGDNTEPHINTQIAPITCTSSNNGHVQQAIKSTANDVANAVVVNADKKVAGEDSFVRRVRRLDKAVKMMAGQLIQLNYYIPKELAKVVGQGHIAVFEEHCVLHMDGSNWLFTEEGLSHRDIKCVFAQWDKIAPIVTQSSLGSRFKRRKTLRKWVTPYTQEQLAAERKAVVEELDQAIQELHENMIERFESASKALEEANAELTEDASWASRNEVMKKHATRLRLIMEDSCKRFARCLRGAEVFDNTGSLNDLIEACAGALEMMKIGVDTLLEVQQLKRVKVPTIINETFSNGIVITHHSINPMTMPPSKQD